MGKIEENGKVLISHADEDDSVDVRSIGPALMKRAQSLISGIEIDLDVPLDDKNE